MAAGVHRGVFEPSASMKSSAFIPHAVARLVREGRLPVVAAGGIMDGVGVAAVLVLRAAAAQLGTAFVGCPESAADEG